jgi:hypothetical protein
MNQKPDAIAFQLSCLLLKPKADIFAVKHHVSLFNLPSKWVWNFSAQAATTHHGKSA